LSNCVLTNRKSGIKYNVTSEKFSSVSVRESSVTLQHKPEFLVLYNNGATNVSNSGWGYVLGNAGFGFSTYNTSTYGIPSFSVDGNVLNWEFLPGAVGTGNVSIRVAYLYIE